MRFPSSRARGQLHAKWCGPAGGVGVVTDKGALLVARRGETTPSSRVATGQFGPFRTRERRAGARRASKGFYCPCSRVGLRRGRLLRESAHAEDEVVVGDRFRRVVPA